MKLTTMTQVTVDGAMQGNGGASDEIEQDLVDEITLLIVPVVLGQGARLFPDAGPDIALDLVDSRADSKGVAIQVYRSNGHPQYAPAQR
jgi:dihydrofolate reductase